MQSLVETNVEPTRKEWVSPELKKIDVEAVTANEGGSGGDGGSFSS
jgi:hypothetical protein